MERRGLEGGWLGGAKEFPRPDISDMSIAGSRRPAATGWEVAARENGKDAERRSLTFRPAEAVNALRSQRQQRHMR